MRAFKASPRFATALTVTTAFFALAVVLLPPTRANAAMTHVFNSEFSTTAMPMSIAVDDATGSIYVATYGGNIEKFDSDGDPQDFSALGTNKIESGGFTNITQIAVDNSGGINQGVIYAATDSFVGMHVYLPSGLHATDFTVDSLGGQGCCQSAATGVAVNNNGSLYLDHPDSSFFAPHLDQFNPGLWLANTPGQTWPVAGFMARHHPGVSVVRLAIDSANSFYEAYGSSVFAGGDVNKYASSVFGEPPGDRSGNGGPPYKVVDTGVNALDVDRSTDDLYTDHGDYIARLDSDGNLQETFADGELGAPGFPPPSVGVAVDKNTHTAYVSVLQANKVRIYKAVTTPDITDVEADADRTTATLSAHLDTAGAGPITGCQFEYGTDTTYGTTEPCSPDPAASPPGSNFNGPTDVSADISSLTPETTYHFRVTATNANGTTRSLDGTFTPHNVADVSTDAPTDITQTSATLHGSFSGDGTPTTYLFEWGPTTAYGSSDSGTVGPSAPTGPTQVSLPITGLDPYGPTSTPYHFRVSVTNSSGKTVGPDMTFHTLPNPAPSVTPGNAVNIGATTATLSALVNPHSSDTVYSFEWGTDNSYGSSTPSSESIGADDVDHPVTADLTGLTAGTTYHFRVIATNFGGTTHGSDQTFTTPDAPTVFALPATAVGQTGATLMAQISPNGRSTTVHFEYGPSAAYGLATPESTAIGSDFSAHGFAATVAGLAPATTYHFRAVATNSVGTKVGPDRTFTTASPPAPPAPPAPACNAAKLSAKAKKASNRAKALRKRARRKSGKRAKALRHRARKAARQAHRASKAAKRCRSSLRRAGNGRRAGK